jgi:6-pyruvoyltetrahydropterin/6-carboxytetrahydropterin synthase
MDHASLTRRYRFAAQHRLHSDSLSDEDNCRIFGKCNNPNGHGHNYVLLVTVQGVGVAELDRLVQETVIARFDHQDLNGDPAFAGQTTTGENVVLLVWEILAARLPKGRLEKVGLVETRDNYFEYAGPAPVRGPDGSPIW